MKIAVHRVIYFLSLINTVNTRHRIITNSWTLEVSGNVQNENDDHICLIFLLLVKQFYITIYIILILYKMTTFDYSEIVLEISSFLSTFQ